MSELADGHSCPVGSSTQQAGGCIQPPFSALPRRHHLLSSRRLSIVCFVVLTCLLHLRHPPVPAPLPHPPRAFLDAAETCTAAANSASTSPRPKSFQSSPALAATGATALQHHLTRPPTHFVCRRLVSTADESDEGDTPAATCCARWDAVGATPSTPAPILLSLFFMETVILDHTPLADYLKGWFL